MAELKVELVQDRQDLNNNLNAILSKCVTQISPNLAMSLLSGAREQSSMPTKGTGILPVRGRTNRERSRPRIGTTTLRAHSITGPGPTTVM